MKYFIKFETAKLAKEKGFSNISSNIYHLDYPKVGKLESSLISYDADDGWVEYNHNRGCDVKIDFNSFIFAPTQNELQNWLRKNHNIIVSSICVYNQEIINDKLVYTFKPSIEILDIVGENIFHCDLKYEMFHGLGVMSYEQALELGLFEALKLIK
jgi:hypothetical protein